MIHFTLRHELQVAPARFWMLFFDRAFNVGLYAFLGFPSWEIVEQREDSAGITRVVRAVPKMDLPPALVSVLGASFGYVEQGRFDRASQTYRYETKPSTLQDRLRNEAMIRCEPRGAERCTRVVEVTAEAKVFGIGRLIEGAIEKNNRVMWARSVELYDRWPKAGPGADAESAPAQA